MHFKQKMAFFVFGCVFVIVGQVVVVQLVPAANAQGELESAEFSHITARSLTILDENGKDRATLYSIRCGGPELIFFGADGQVPAMLSGSQDGGLLVLDGPDKGGHNLPDRQLWLGTGVGDTFGVHVLDGINAVASLAADENGDAFIIP